MGRSLRGRLAPRLCGAGLSLEAVSKVLYWIVFPLCNFVLSFVILCGSMI